MRVLSINRFTSLHSKSAVCTQVGQVRNFLPRYLESNHTLWRTRLISGGFGCVTSLLRTDRNICKQTVYLQNVNGRRHVYNRQCIRYLSTRNAYDDAFTTARDNPEKFWSAAAQNISWFEPWHQLLDKTDLIFPQWWVRLLFLKTTFLCSSYVFWRGMRNAFVELFQNSTG